jgi:putative transcriptional regulator
MILDLARGALAHGPQLVLRTHVGACADCAAALRLAEAVGGVLIDELAPTDMAEGALEKALAAIDAPPPSPQPPKAKQPIDWIHVPEEVLVAAERNRRWAAPGVWVAPIRRDGKSGARSYLLGIGPGIAVPRHTHRGSELICVLKGAFEDRGEIVRAGDLTDSDERVEHRPRVTMDSECVCLVAVDHALVPRDLIGRLMQPFVGI